MTKNIIKNLSFLVLSVCFATNVYAGTSNDVKKEDKEAAAAAADSAKAGEEAKKEEAKKDDSANDIDETLYNKDLTESSTKVVEDLKAYVKEISEHTGEDKDKFTAERTEKFFADHSGAKDELPSIEDQVIKGKKGNDISVRVYGSTAGETGDLIIFVHGSGWMPGSLETHDYLCRKISNIFGFDVVAVNYRALPADVFSVSLEDVRDVYDHYTTTASYGHVILMGDGVGGSLCAALCAKLHEEEGKMPYAQVLFYPLVSNDFGSRSFQTFGDSPALTKDALSQYVQASAVEAGDKTAYPVLQEDVAFFPKTAIITAGHDILLDGQMAFVKKLKDANLNPLHVIDRGVIHGYMAYGSHYESLIADNCEKVKAYLAEQDSAAPSANGSGEETSSDEKKDEAASDEKKDESADDGSQKSDDSAESSAKEEGADEKADDHAEHEESHDDSDDEGEHESEE